MDEVECTSEPRCYDHPNNPKIKFWDLPGITDPTYEGDLEKYCENVPFDKYHTYLIFAKDRFTADELKLVKKIRSTVIASSLSYAATYYFLVRWLEVMERLANKVLEETLEKIRP